ncbi:MAG: response regulator [Holophagae bacterium]|jgi:chemotaxis protein histidine kinase CheA
MALDGELLNLFLEEAAERLEEMHALMADIGDEGELRLQLGRQLHALKGGSRMMGFTELAELCHRAEDTIEADQPLNSESVSAFLEAIGEAVRKVDESVRGSAKPEQLARGSVQARDELRVPLQTIDELADRGARLRVVAAGAEGLVQRVYRLVSLAERGSAEPEPSQVLATLAASLRQVGLDLESGQRIFRRLTERQLDGLLSLQVQPLHPFLTTLSDHARELGDGLDKRVTVEIDGGEAQLDRRIVEALREAFLHLVRNAVDHGIESPAARASAGKDERGSIRIEAGSAGARVRVRVTDDGRGIDPDEVLATAIERKVIDASSAARLGPSELLQLVCEPGFSTRSEASELSGRGIGLDAVAAAVGSIGGDLWLESEVGRGTSVTVEIPAARRGERVVILELGDNRIAVPSSPVKAYRPVTVVDDGGLRRVLDRHGEEVAARFLGDMIGEPTMGAAVLVEMMFRGAVIGIVAGDVVGEEEVIVYPLPRSAGAPAGVDGVSLLSSGRTVAVASHAGLGSLEAGPGPTPSRSQAVRSTRVLLVDDSHVTREMLRRLLADAGCRVTGAASAEDALAALDEAEFDCVVTDIEMPGMDGLALTRALRRQPSHADLPVIVVSTLDRPADRLAGLESGADAYLTKQRLDARELVSLVRRVGGGR